MIKGSAAIFTITGFVSAGNMARQGRFNYDRAVGAVIGVLFQLSATISSQQLSAKEDKMVDCCAG